ncbi:hypothetical protein M9H77_00481 [Catharanthus roseus]|nr:hypothetical protein M9H77_00481 [Catharanthus roseus]
MQRIQLLILLRLRQGHPRTHPLPGSHLLLALDLNRLLRRIRSNSKGGLAVLAPQKLSTVTSVGSSVCAGLNVAKSKGRASEGRNGISYLLKLKEDKYRAQEKLFRAPQIKKNENGTNRPRGIRELLALPYEEERRYGTQEGRRGIAKAKAMEARQD